MAAHALWQLRIMLAPKIIRTCGGWGSLGSEWAEVVQFWFYALRGHPGLDKKYVQNFQSWIKQCIVFQTCIEMKPHWPHTILDHTMMVLFHFDRYHVSPLERECFIIHDILTCPHDFVSIRPMIFAVFFNIRMPFATRAFPPNSGFVESSILEFNLLMSWFLVSPLRFVLLFAAT